jgi:hypothetical protein
LYRVVHDVVDGDVALCDDVAGVVSHPEVDGFVAVRPGSAVCGGGDVPVRFRRAEVLPVAPEDAVVGESHLVQARSGRGIGGAEGQVHKTVIGELLTVVDGHCQHVGRDAVVEYGVRGRAS